LGYDSLFIIIAGLNEFIEYFKVKTNCFKDSKNSNIDSRVQYL